MHHANLRGLLTNETFAAFDVLLTTLLCLNTKFELLNFFRISFNKEAMDSGYNGFGDMSVRYDSVNCVKLPLGVSVL